MAEWRTIPGFRNYEVSSEGDVRRSAGGPGAVVGRVLSVKTNRRGYVDVVLSHNGIVTYHRVHRLVALAFIPRVRGKPRINHRNGVRSYNWVENLEWCTDRENYQHAVANGLMLPLRPNPATRPRGEHHGNAMLCDCDVLEIRRLRAAGHTLKEITSRFNVCLATIHNAATGRYWGHV